MQFGHDLRLSNRIQNRIDRIHKGVTMIDLSLPIHPEMLHGGRHPSRETVGSIADGDSANVSRWLLSAHAGTHVEAPLHTSEGGAAIDALGLDLLVGPARVLDLTAVTTEVTAADLLAAGLGDSDPRVLLKTSNSAGVLQEAVKAEEWVGLAPDAAQLLVDRGVKLLGVDYLTVESPSREATFDSHYVLNGAGVAMIESVDLREVAAGEVELVCLPLLLDGAEAAPARVLVGPPRATTGTLIDLSVHTTESMLHWGRRPERTVVESFANGNACNVTRWLLGAHTGTHLDAPLHYVDGAGPIDAVGLDVLVGPATVLDLTGVTGDVTAADLEAAGVGDAAARVLLKTTNSTGALRAAEKPQTWVGLAPDGAQLLVDRGVELVGIDFLTIDGPTQTDTWEAHHVLCGAGIVILECADLAAVDAGAYELTALPIPLRGAEAAPGRAFLRTV
jgi:kynurenine formamidase